MNDRRENTNQHGAKVPTETKAIRRIEAEDMKQARKLYGLIVRACNFGGFYLRGIELEYHGQTYTEADLQKGADHDTSRTH